MKGSLFSKQDLYIGFVRAILVPIILFYFIGIKWGFVAYCSVRFVIKQIICKRMLKQEPLTVMDEFFLYDSPKNRSNIMIVTHIDRLGKDEGKDFVEFAIDHVKSRFGASVDIPGNGFPRMSSKLVKICGEFYFKQMSEAEYQSKRVALCEVINDGSIKTEQQVCDFVAREQVKRDPLDTC